MTIEDQNRTNAVDDSTATKRPTQPTSTSRVDHGSAASETSANDSPAGHTSIAESVVAKIVGIAAREVPGVYALGGGGERALGMLRETVNATDFAQGVKVDVGETQAAADVTIVVEYPAPIQEVAERVRAAVADAITQLVGLQVVEVNVNVNDVNLPSDADNDDASDNHRPSVS